jgi:hypothetical protein
MILSHPGFLLCPGLLSGCSDSHSQFRVHGWVHSPVIIKSIAPTGSGTGHAHPSSSSSSTSTSYNEETKCISVNDTFQRTVVTKVSGHIKLQKVHNIEVNSGITTYAFTQIYLDILHTKIHIYRNVYKYTDTN